MADCVLGQIGQMIVEQEADISMDSVQCIQCGKRPFSDRLLAALHCSATISISQRT